MALSSPGIGSGLDVNGIVGQLVELERRPITLLQTAKTRLNTQLSSFGLLQSYMSNLQSIAGQLAKAEFWARNTATSSDTAAVAVSASGSAARASYAVEVHALARAQSLRSGVIADASNIGTGTLTITRGSTTVDITLADGDHSLQALRDRINAADAGVSAAIVTDGVGPRLILSATATGIANAVTINTSGATGALASVTHPGGLAEQAAADAAFTVNGLALTSPSNALAGVIDGIDLTLSKTTSGPVQIAVGRDTTALAKGIRDFVAAYNDLNRYLATQTKYDETTKTAGALQGDRTAIGLQAKLRTLVQQPSAASAVYARLADFGLSLQRDGSLQIDEAGLTAALARPDEAAKAFAGAGNGLALGFKALADGMLGSDGALSSRSEGLRHSIRRNEREQERLEDRIGRVRERLLRQYAALDNSLNQLNGLSSFVTQQITNWNKSSDT